MSKIPDPKGYYLRSFRIFHEWFKRFQCMRKVWQKNISKHHHQLSLLLCDKIKGVTMWNRVDSLLPTAITDVFMSPCQPHISEYHYNMVKKYFTTNAIPLRLAIFLLLGNLRTSTNQFFPQPNLCCKSAENYPARKLEELSPKI